MPRSKKSDWLGNAIALSLSILLFAVAIIGAGTPALAPEQAVAAGSSRCPGDNVRVSIGRAGGNIINSTAGSHQCASSTVF